MYFLYSILMVVWGILLCPVLLIKWWRQRKYPQGVRQRFGRLPDSVRSDGRPAIWFHCCSVGETLSAQLLVHLLHQKFPDARFIFSTITNTGQEIAKQRFSKYGAGNSFFFPVDLSSIATRVIQWIKPAMVIIVDTEIWPNMLHQLKRRGIPAVLVNGRISAASFPYYRFFRPVLRRVFQNYSAFLMKSEEDAVRIRNLGAPSDKVLVTGNIKYDCDLTEKERTAIRARALQEAFGLQPDGDALIVAGSTHPGEEQALLEALRRMRQMQGLERMRLLLAPRHPERFDSVAELAGRMGFHVQRRTNGKQPDQDAEVLILDTIGELAAAYSFATVAFVGGTLVRHGGHSIMEPALYAKPIVIGPSMENFPQIIDEFLAHGGIHQILTGEEDKNLQIQHLTEVLSQLVLNPTARETMGEAAYSVLENNQGAAQRTAEKIAALFQEGRSR
jgi:3-deoxy-D-manno-octulosonic-acid transferase